MSKLSTDQATALLMEIIGGVAPDIADELPDLDKGDDLWAVLGLDSMDHLNVMTALADRTGVEIPERDYGKLRSLDSLAAYLTN